MCASVCSSAWCMHMHMCEYIHVYTQMYMHVYFIHMGVCANISTHFTCLRHSHNYILNIFKAHISQTFSCLHFKIVFLCDFEALTVK